VVSRSKFSLLEPEFLPRLDVNLHAFGRGGWWPELTREPKEKEGVTPARHIPKALAGGWLMRQAGNKKR